MCIVSGKRHCVLHEAGKLLGPGTDSVRQVIQIDDLAVGEGGIHYIGCLNSPEIFALESV